MNTLKLLRKACAISALPLLVALSATTVGCLGHTGPSEVAQGQRYESGDPTYDQFFQAVHDLSVELSAAPKREAELRLSLGKELGVEPEEDDADVAAPVAEKPANMDGAPVASDAPSAPSPTDAYEQQLKQGAINAIPGAATVNAVSAQVEQAKQTVGQFKALFGGAKPETPSSKPAAPPAPQQVKKGPKAPSASLVAKAVKTRAKKLEFEMKLDVDESGLEAGDAKAKVLTAGDADEGKKLAKLVEETAQGELELLGKLAAAKKKLAKLAAVGGALDANVDSTFRKSRAKMSEVRTNLADAKALIELMEQRTSEVDKKARLMLTKLGDAASAKIDAPAPVPESTKHAEKVEPKKAKTEERAVKSEKSNHSEPPKAKAKKSAGARSGAPRTAMADFEP
ncbi:MAG: hypothetical protein U0263_38010 [Polyangiaceae bacterium]